MYTISIKMYAMFTLSPDVYTSRHMYSSRHISLKLKDIVIKKTNYLLASFPGVSQPVITR